jgi:hypothetical protein
MKPETIGMAQPESKMSENKGSKKQPNPREGNKISVRKQAETVGE